MEFDTEAYIWFIITTIIFIYCLSQDTLTSNPIDSASATNY